VSFAEQQLDGALGGSDRSWHERADADDRGLALDGGEDAGQFAVALSGLRAVHVSTLR
jgi:hypothetical protein